MASRTPSKAAEALEKLDAAETLLSHLIGIGPTAERHALHGSLNKRRAMIDIDVKGRRDALARMSAAYSEGYKLVSQSGTAAGLYPFTNQAAAETMLGWVGKGNAKSRAAAARSLAQLDEMAGELQSSTAFFDLAARGDLLLLRALAAKKISASASEQIVKAYVAAGQRGVSPKHKESFLDQLDFFSLMTDLLPARQGKTMREQLKQLRDSLGASL